MRAVTLIIIFIQLGLFPLSQFSMYHHKFMSYIFFFLHVIVLFFNCGLLLSRELLHWLNYHWMTLNWCVIMHYSIVIIIIIRAEHIAQIRNTYIHILFYCNEPNFPRIEQIKDRVFVCRANNFSFVRANIIFSSLANHKKVKNTASKLKI